MERINTLSIEICQEENTLRKFYTESIAVSLSRMNDWKVRAKSRMRELNLTQEKVAERFGVTQGTVGHWLSGRREPETLAKFEELAKFLKFNSLHEMLHGDSVRDVCGNYDVGPAPEITRRVPLISIVQAGKLCEGHPFPPDDVEHVPTTARLGPRAYALRIHGDSMQAPPGSRWSFPEGAIIFVDPDAPAESGNFIIALVENETTFKQLVIDGGRHYLKPLNPGYQARDVTGNYSVCGVVKRMQIDT